MAPLKFGIFKARSRDHPEQPSTENLLQNNDNNYEVPGSPVPSTSTGIQGPPLEAISITMYPDSEDEANMNEARIDSDDDSSILEGRDNFMKLEDEVDYELLGSQGSLDDIPTSTLQADYKLSSQPELEDAITLDPEADSTSCDANSSELDVTSITASELSIYCASLKKPKKSRSKEERHWRDLDMWQASNIEVMQNLLTRSGTVDEQIKWEAIATARGLCTLTDNCTCNDCTTAKYLTGIADGDGGLGAAPLFSAINVGCQIQ